MQQQKTLTLTKCNNNKFNNKNTTTINTIPKKNATTITTRKQMQSIKTQQKNKKNATTINTTIKKM